MLLRPNEAAETNISSYCKRAASIVTSYTGRGAVLVFAGTLQ